MQEQIGTLPLSVALFSCHVHAEHGHLLSNLFLYQFPMFREDLTPGKHAHKASAVYPNGRRNRSGIQNNSHTFPTQTCSRSRHSILATARSQILVHQSNTVDNIYRFVWLVSPCAIVILFCSAESAKAEAQLCLPSTLVSYLKAHNTHTR